VQERSASQSLGEIEREKCEDCLECHVRSFPSLRALSPSVSLFLPLAHAHDVLGYFCGEKKRAKDCMHARAPSSPTCIVVCALTDAIAAKQKHGNTSQWLTCLCNEEAIPVAAQKGGRTEGRELKKESLMQARGAPSRDQRHTEREAMRRPLATGWFGHVLHAHHAPHLNIKRNTSGT